MNAATILIILLSHQGYWLGGQEETISIAWNVNQAMPAASLQWDLMLGDVRLAREEAKMPAGNDSAIITLKIPPVRARTQMRWVYRVMAADGGKELASGQELLNIFPSISLDDVAPRLAGQKIFVVDKPAGLPAILQAAKIDASCVKDTSNLQSTQADLIIVAADKLSDSPFAQAPLLSQAKAGAQVLIMEQKQPRTLCGYALSRRPVNLNLSWRADHPLFAGLDENDLKSWLRGYSGDLPAIRLPADEAALEVAYWPRESPGKEPVPIDALLVVKAVGKGRIILCQIPLGDWQDDPRSRIFLYNALNYMLTRPEPTPPPSERPTTQPAPVVPPPGIKISSGDNP